MISRRAHTVRYMKQQSLAMPIKMRNTKHFRKVGISKSKKTPESRRERKSPLITYAFFVLPFLPLSTYFSFFLFLTNPKTYKTISIYYLNATSPIFFPLHFVHNIWLQAAAPIENGYGFVAMYVQAHAQIRIRRIPYTQHTRRHTVIVRHQN